MNGSVYTTQLLCHMFIGLESKSWPHISEFSKKGKTIIFGSFFANILSQVQGQNWAREGKENF